LAGAPPSVSIRVKPGDNLFMEEKVCKAIAIVKASVLNNGTFAQ
jgi:hypothetical protein